VQVKEFGFPLNTANTIDNKKAMAINILIELNQKVWLPNLAEGEINRSG
jgi:hypothetical protein